MTSPVAPPTTMGSVTALVARFPDVHVVVLGDAILDVWQYGTSARLCREAPVPVVDLTARRACPGGAANTAVNLAELGARSTFVSAVGTDDAGRELEDLLLAAGVQPRLVRVPGRRTVTKNRLVVGDHIIVRTDSGDTDPLPEGRAVLLRRTLDDALAGGKQGVLVADYHGGVLDQATTQRLRRHRDAVPVLAVDSQRPQDWSVLRPDLVTPSYDETRGLFDAGLATTPADRATMVEAHASTLLAGTGAARLAVTLDSDGAVILEQDIPAYRTYARPVPAGRTSGAGDAYISAFTLGLCAGASTTLAAETAQLAASAAMTGTGTAVCRAADLLCMQDAAARRILGGDGLADALAEHRRRGERVVFTNGCFDVLHRGHVAYLNEAKRLGDVLVVALNADESVRRLKGADRPVNGLDDRATVLAALSCVDYVVSFGEDTPERLLAQVRPDCYVKGGDYTGKPIPERELVRRLGGDVRVLGYVEERSTSALIQRIRGGSSGDGSTRR